MIKSNSNIGFDTFSHLSTYNRDNNRKNIFIGMCGYECRSRKMFEIVSKERKEPDKSFGLIFEEFKDLAETKVSSNFYGENGAIITNVSYTNLYESLDIISSIISTEKYSDVSLSINIDISSMPRFMYCSLPKYLNKILDEKDILVLWYIPGQYIESDFPTAGISNLVLFSGKASLKPQKRAHIIGLGFDSIRSEGMLTVIDPNYLVTFYSNPSFSDEYTKRILNDNKNMFNKSELVIPLNIFDYESSMSKLISISKTLMQEFEVVIIPDGPKPFILIGSIIPDLINTEGIISLHVNSNRRDFKRFIDVKAIGNPIGISFEKQIFI
jgi:hypothetical protein